jgi:hypothetical protein
MEFKRIGKMQLLSQWGNVNFAVARRYRGNQQKIR